MSSIIVNLRPMLIFLMSATAVSFWGIRLSDLAFLLFGFSLILSRVDFDLLIDKISFSLIILIQVIFVSTFYTFSSGSEVMSSNAVGVPLSIFVSLIFLLVINPDDLMKIIKGYPACILVTTLLIGVTKWLGYNIPWIVYEDEMDRFSGLSQNPNQLALYLLPAPFFSLMAYLKNEKNKLLVGIEIFAAIAINMFVLGKTLFVGWIISFGFLFLIGFVYFGKIKLYNLNFIIKLIFVPFFLVLIMPIAILLYKGQTAGSVEGQGEDRLILWSNGLNAWLDSFLLGHGPGHYSGIESSYQGMEAHNFWIDWLSAYGFIGYAALTFYLLLNFIKVIRLQVWIVISMYLSLLVQSTFHFYGRQPFFWLILVIGYMVAFEFSSESDRE